MKRVIVGAGGQALEMFDYLNKSTDIRFLIDPQYSAHHALPSEQVITSTSQLDGDDYGVVIGVGAPLARKTLFDRGWPRFFSVISDNCHISESAIIGEGSVVSPMSVVSSAVRIGRHTQINIGATISHDCSIGDFVTIAPGVSIGGGVSIGDGAFIGIGSTIKQGVTIAEGTLIGAGAVVINDIEEPLGIYVGNPAHRLRTLEGWLNEIN